MNWIELNSTEALENIISKSFETPVLIYKHSSRCSISSIVRFRLERSWAADDLQLPAYFLDLIAFRDISDTIEDQYGVNHESPQVLLIVNGNCVYHASHLGISHGALREAVNGVSA